MLLNQLKYILMKILILEDVYGLNNGVNLKYKLKMLNKLFNQEIIQNLVIQI